MTQLPTELQKEIDALLERQPFAGQGDISPTSGKYSHPLCQADKRGGYVESSRWNQFTAEMGIAFVQHKSPVRSSYGNDLLRCPRYFMFRDRMGLHLKGQVSKALKVGTIYHWMSEAIYAGKNVNEALIFASKNLTDMNDTLAKEADESGLLPGVVPIERVVAENEQAFSLAQVMFLCGYDIFFSAPWLVQEGWTPLLTEEVLEIRYNGIAVPIRCKPDALMVQKDTGDIMIVGHKTVGRSLTLAAASYRWAFQARLEHLVVQTAFPDHKVRYYCQNMILKPTIKFPTKNSPTFPDYLTNVRQWYADRIAKDPNDPPMIQSRIGLPPDAMNRELYIRIHELARASACWPSPDRFYRNDSACDGKYGNSLCPFHSLCSTDESAWKDLIDRNYTISFREDEEDAEE
jgi:hypothetical protein